MYKNAGKRILDILVSLMGLLLLLPFILLIMLIIYVQDSKPPFFTQKRVGYQGKIFTLVKFRSMPVHTDNVPSSEASRIQITPFGKFIRRTNLDELPQLFNILKGDMSIVGPRPSLITQEELIRLRSVKNIYACRPGLTGLAQVNSYNGMPDEKKVWWDEIYVNNLTFFTDIKIILQTFIYITKKPPVY